MPEETITVVTPSPEPVIAAVGEATSIVASEVIAVSDQLEAHAETSEERHEEILEGQQWQENQFNLMGSRLTALESSLLATTTLLQSISSSLQNLNLSPVLNPSTPPTPSNPEPEPTEVIVVEPESEEVVLPAPVVEEKPARRRRFI